MISQRVKDRIKQASNSQLRQDFPRVAEVVSIVGAFSDDEREIFATLIMGDHRTIQQRIIGTFLRAFYIMSKNGTDARNKAAVDACKTVVKTLGEYGWQLPYI